MERLINPPNGILLFVAINMAYGVIMAYHGEFTSAEADVVFQLGFALLLTWWVYVDRRQRRYPVPFEFEAFVFFAWLLVVPYYLFKTRGRRAAPGCIALVVVFSLPYLVALIVYEAVLLSR